MSCCPEGALGKLGTQGYVAKVDLVLTKCKVSTKSPHFKGSCWESWWFGYLLCGIRTKVYYLELWHFWIWFWQNKVRSSSETFSRASWFLSRQTADLFAEAGYLVVMPDFYRGTWKDPTQPDVVQFIKDQTNWTKLKVDLEKVLSFAKKKGEKFNNFHSNYQVETYPFM